MNSQHTSERASGQAGRRRAGALARLVLACGVLVAGARAAHVHYRLEQGETESGATAWIVEVQVAGARARDGTLRFELDGFGGWEALGRPYLELLEALPAASRAEPAAGRFEIAVPRRGDDTVRLRYRIELLPMNGEAQRSHGLLPAGGDAYSFGWSWNVLVDVSDDHGPLTGERTLELIAPDRTTIVTGWAGESTGHQRATLDVTMGNAPIAFGTPAFRARLGDDAFAVDVWQFGEGSEIADVVARVLASGAPLMGRLFGQPARQPYRAFVTDHQGGGMGSHFGLRVSHTADEPPERRDSPWFAAFVLHEHIHDWLGLTVSDADESLVWFKEGFTEYLSLWAAAATGLVPRRYFATRLLELEEIARTRSALGEVRFGDPSVRWRDGDGPIERLAYTGAPLLALLVDVELRERAAAGGGGGREGGSEGASAGASAGGSDAPGAIVGLPALVAALVADGPRTIDRADLQHAFEAVGLAEVWKRSVDGTHLPPLEELLPRAGFHLDDVPVDLAYLGLRTDDAMGGKVLAVDEDGPAARAGVTKGDVITGFYPLRSPPANADAHATRYRFGLDIFEPGIPDSFLGVRRGKQELKLPIVPQVLPGAGTLRDWREDGVALDAFFAPGA